MSEAKRHAHLALFDRWLPDPSDKSLLKTDLWEEGIAGDELLFTFARGGAIAHGVDVSPLVVASARERAAQLSASVTLLQADVRALPFEPGSMDVVVSTSTLDHLEDEGQHRVALTEMRRVLARGGVLAITVDNRQNVFDWALRAAAAVGLIPFPLGPAPSRDQLVRLLEDAQLRPDCYDYLVPAPRLLGTAAVRLARLLPQRPSDAAVSKLLSFFETLGRRAPERMSCFVAVRATAV